MPATGQKRPMSGFEVNDRVPSRNDSSGAALGETEVHSIQAYVSDMLALERHIAMPLSRQLEMNDTGRFGAAQTILTEIKRLTDAHVTELERLLEQIGGSAASPVKSAWSSMLGAGAAAIDSVRKTKVSKSLRDDYTALGLASISYTMLYTTAVGFGDMPTANLAQRHLGDYARAVMQIAQAMPSIVLLELQADGETTATDAAETIRRQINEIWKSQLDVAQS